MEYAPADFENLNRTAVNREDRSLLKRVARMHCCHDDDAVLHEFVVSAPRSVPGREQVSEATANPGPTVFHVAPHHDAVVDHFDGAFPTQPGGKIARVRLIVEARYDNPFLSNGEGRLDGGDNAKVWQSDPLPLP